MVEGKEGPKITSLGGKGSKPGQMRCCSTETADHEAMKLLPPTSHPVLD